VSSHFDLITQRTGAPHASASARPDNVSVRSRPVAATSKPVTYWFYDPIRTSTPPWKGAERPQPPPPMDLTLATCRSASEWDMRLLTTRQRSWRCPLRPVRGARARRVRRGDAV